MKEYYCRVQTKDGRRVWGYRSALTADLALACLLQDEGLTEDDIANSMTDQPENVLLARLMEFIPTDFDPWGCDPPFNWVNVYSADESSIEALSANEPYSGTSEIIQDPHWHAARIMYLLKNPKLLGDPISIDNQCNNGMVYPIPVVLDGWHRIFAHRIVGSERLRVSYGGRTDLLRYLTGKRKRPPQY